MKLPQTVLAGLALLGFCGMGRAQEEAFYKSHPLEVLVGFSPGGGYDAYGRALASVLGRYIPGNPSVVVRNMTGAGSLRLATYLADAAPRDGTSIGIFDNGLLVAPLLKPQTAKFDASKLGWVGSTAKDTQICMVWSQLPITRLEDLRTRQTTFGVTGLDDIRYMSTAMLRHIAGANVKIIAGYPGSTDIRLAMERGELEGVCDSWQSLKSTKADWVDEHKVKILVQMTEKPISELPDVATIASFAKDASMKAAIDLLVSPGEAGRSFAAPPDIPAPRLAILRRAFESAVKDPDFLATTTKARLEVDPMPGIEIEKFLKRVYQAKPAEIDLARRLIE